MRVTELRYFLMVAETGSFGKAAQFLCLQASTLSRAIARLEDQLGVTLLERTPTGIRVTASGHIALRHIRRVLNETNALTETVGRGFGGQTGEIHLGFHLPPINNLMAKLLLEWRTIYPGVSVTPYEQGDGALHAALADYRIDAALVPDFLLSRYKARTPLYHEPLMVVLPTSHCLTSRSTLQWNDLLRENLLLWSWGKDGIGQGFFSARLPGVNVRILETGNMTLLAFVRAGYGITVAAQAYSALNLPGLTFIPLDEADARIEINLVWRPETEDPIVGKFVAFMRDRTKLHRQQPPARAASESPDPPP